MSEFLEIIGLSENDADAFENFKVVKNAVSKVLSGNYCELKLPRGRFPIYNPKAIELRDKLLNGEISATDYDFFNNNKNIAFYFVGLKDFKITGDNTTFLFDGLIQPFDFKFCENLRVKGITIDWINPLYFSADVIAKHKNKVSFILRSNSIINGGEPIVSIQNVNLNSGEQGGMSLFENISNVNLNDGDYSFECAEPEMVNIGESLVLRHVYNYAPAIHFYRCKNITTEDITIHSAVGMGIIGQKVENINLYRLYVKPSNGRPMSTNTDATHFINCSGLINFNTCYFEGMGDDATNIHGFYLRIKKVEGNKIYFAQEQQCQDGINYCPDIGQKIELVNSKTLQTYGEATVKSVDFDNKNGCGYIYFEEDIASIAKENDCIANATEVARLNFENCTVKKIRGRGVLLQTRGAVIKNCLFKGCTGEGIHICTETGWWESISTRDILITENRFIDCGFGSTKYCDAVAVVTSTNAPKQTVGVHKDIKIIGNYIMGENRPVLITCAENVLVSENLIGCKREIEVLNSENIIIKDNELVDYDDIFKINPAVFAVGKEYQIMQPIDKEYLYSVKIGDKIYYDEINGIMRSDCEVHRVTVPMHVLDKNKEYTVIVRRINDRVHNTPLCSNETIEKTYIFKPIPENDARAYYIADSHNLVKAAIDACNTFGNIDFLILNGDLQCHSAIKEDYLLAYDIASELTKGEIPVVFGRGNHETLGRNAEHINDYIPNQNGKTYFTFRLGNIWGLMLDCGCDHRDDMSEYSGTMNCFALRERQIDFINDIISNADSEYNADGVEIRLIISHIPFTDHMTGKPQENIETYGIWQKLIEENIKPDLMISGHMHVYSYYKENCAFPLIVASKLTADLFGGTGFIFTENEISAINTDSEGNSVNIGAL